MASIEINEADILEVSAKSRFTRLDNDRTTVLDRGRDCSLLTIPSVMPEDGHNEDTKLETPYQAVGSRLVNNLASKLLLSLLPPNTSFFRLIVDDELKANLTQEGVPEAINEIERKLVTIEQGILKQIEREAIRVPIFEAIKNLIITGNSLVYKTEDNLRVYKLSNYVVTRDFSGTPVEIVMREVVTKDTLPEDILNQLDDDISDDTDIFVYTRAILKDNKFYEYQYVNDVVVEGSMISYNADESPYIPLRWTSINGENYGRGLVEQYLGDFRSLEGLYQLMIEASAVQSRILFGKRAGSQLDIDELNNAKNGDFIFGDLERDVSVLRVEKGGDLQLPMQMMQDLTRRLEQAFLVASSATREAERVTLGEIRYLASDLEATLGGVHSILSLELQRPLAKILLKQSGVDLASLGIEAIIVTGIEALGRNAELEKLRQFNALLQELGSPEQVIPRMNIGAYITMMGNALELDTSTLIKSDEQLAQEQQQAEQAQLEQQASQGMIEQGVQAMGGAGQGSQQQQ